MLKLTLLTLKRTPVKTLLIVVFLSGVICLSLVGIGMYTNSVNAIDEIHSTFITTGKISLKRGRMLDRMTDWFGYDRYDGSYNMNSQVGFFGGGGGYLNTIAFKSELDLISNSPYVSEFFTKYSTYSVMGNAKRVLMEYYDGVSQASGVPLKRLYSYDDIFIGNILGKTVNSQRLEDSTTTYKVEIIRTLYGGLEEGTIIDLCMTEPVGLLKVGNNYILGAEPDGTGGYKSALLYTGFEYDYLANSSYVMYQGKAYNVGNYIPPVESEETEGSEEPIEPIEPPVLTAKDMFPHYYSFVNGYPWGISAVTTEFTSNAEMADHFRTGQIKLHSGEFFSKEDYINGNMVAIVSENLARKNGLSIGDKITISLLPYRSDSFVDGQYAPVGETNFTEYTIKGIYEAVDAYATNNYALNLLRYNSVYVPLNSYKNFDPFYEFFVKTMRTYDANIKPEYSGLIIEDWDYNEDNVVFYLDQSGFVMKNHNTQQEFTDYLIQNGFDLSQFSLSFDDQGFGAIEPALKELKKTSIYWLAGCLFAAVAAMAFIVYLFVVKNRKETAIMMCLGEKRSSIIKAMYMKILTLTLVATVIGFTAGNFIAGKVLSFTYETYYNSQFDRLSLYQHTPSSYQFSSQLSVPAHVMTTAFTFFLTLGISGFIVWQTVRTEPIEALSSAGRQG